MLHANADQDNIALFDIGCCLKYLPHSLGGPSLTKKVFKSPLGI